MGVKKDYINNMVDIIKRMNPDLDEDDIKKAVSSVVKQELKDPTITMDNNVTGEYHEITLTKMCEWIDRTNPVISGNATFYCQPEVLESPTSNMLRSLKKGRKTVKNEMFKYNPNSDEYSMLDLDQYNKKVIMNAEYGGSGAPTAAFYTKYSPAATTLMAQSIITTMAAFFESFIGDNQKFYHINECFDWMNRVLLKKDKVPKWIMVPTVKDVVNRISHHFDIIGIDDYKTLDLFISTCNRDELVYLYYANNIKEFISRHLNVSTLIGKILSTLPLLEAAEKEVPDQYKNNFVSDDFSRDVDKYNKWVSQEMFLDPYKIPECIKSYMNDLKNLVTQFVYVEYITPDSIVKLNNHLRNTVLLVDTDSNIINADIFVEFVIKELYPGEKFGRPSLYNEMILVNILASLLSECVASLLDYYGRCHNMNKEARAELTMKNEFLFRRLFLMKTKKRYSSSIVLREGNIMIPYKLEIKGMDFIKAGVSDEVSNRFTKMLEDHVLFSEDIELHQLMKDLKKFESEIFHNLKMGGTAYLKKQQFKAEGAYKKPWSIQVYKGTAIWNILNPQNKINSLDRVSILKTIVSKPEDLEIIKHQFPKEYDKVMNNIYNSSNPDIQKIGIKIIAIPNTVKKIPAWLLPLVDYDIIVSDVISSFRSVLDALNIEEMYYKTPNGNANIVSCLVSL